MTQVAVVDYGIGNIYSMLCALRRLGLETELTGDPTRLHLADGLILPGDGNFGAASANLDPIKEVILEVVEEGRPLLGSCLGMQLLFERSEEAPGSGLALLKGRIKRFTEGLKIPHMGWNTVNSNGECSLLEGVDGRYFYFVHSFYPEPNDPDDSAATTMYGVEFTSVVHRGNIYGTQFHPEKSGSAGAALLANYSRLVRR
jgi:imidazole glycerol-phosphate synthase subunit HisH